MMEEETDWSAESQVLIPAEHLNADLEPNSSPNTNDMGTVI